MGVPAFFRWLSRKYPSIVVHCDDGVKGKYNFDNLYLDMNGIIHPCSHPENKPPPTNEEEMFLAIFEYVEDIMKIVRPKKLLYMAVDGVAPRAKMNQQRSRRFRAAQESQAKIIEVQKVKDELRERGVELKEKNKEAHFDSNVITPGTDFMVNLSEALRTWIFQKLSENNNDKDGIWLKDLVIILSDASVPGEGEHKIMDYIRRQKSSENFNPNLSHCLYGADADLIMLGLATHEPNFTILREEFKPNQPKPCDLCGQLGHLLKDCTGDEKPLEELPIPAATEFIYIRLNVLREYLQKECSNTNIQLNFERFIDDYVFLCFFVGNDFLPHLPSLEIRENAIDRLIKIYKFVIEKYSTDDDSDFYLTKDGIVNKLRAQYVLQELGDYEDDIFKQRQISEENFKQRNKRRKLMQAEEDLKWMSPEAISKNERPQVFKNAKEEAYKVRMAFHNNNNNEASIKLKQMLVDPASHVGASKDKSVFAPSTSIKRKLENDSDSEPEDLVQLHTEGWRNRYYLHKFGTTSVSKVSSLVAKEYFKGLCWVLLYYYQGCPDWKWFFPFHYAPFASDFKEIGEIEVDFDSSAKPFNPLEQLMSVFPAASSKNLPQTWRQLMMDSHSPIIDFYPTNFRIDLNGKKAAWMGVALLPFIDEERLFDTLKNVYNDLNENEIFRNRHGAHLIFVSRKHSVLSEIIDDVIRTDKVIDQIGKPENFEYNLISGSLKKNSFYSEINERAFCCEFQDPQYDEKFIFPAVLLKKANLPHAVLKPQDLERFDRYRPVIGMNSRRDQGYLGSSGYRMLEHSLHKEQQHIGRHREHSSYSRNYYNHNNYYRPVHQQHYRGQVNYNNNLYQTYTQERPYYNNRQNNYQMPSRNNHQYYQQPPRYQQSSRYQQRPPHY